MSPHSISTEVTCERCGTVLEPRGECPKCLLEFGLQAKSSSRDASQSPTAAPEPMSLEYVTDLLPQFEILGLLGYGAMGSVYKACNKFLGRVVALKVLHPCHTDDPELVERTLREAQALAKFSHPNIFTCYSAGESEGHVFLELEYVEGQTLAPIMECNIPLERRIALLKAICDGLAHAHRHDIIHRDLKPTNILIGANGSVKVADFGLAKSIAADVHAAQLTLSSYAGGTLGYMAPEQFIKGATIDHRVDIYALGVIAYQLHTGRWPAGRFDPPSKWAKISPDLDSVILKCLSQDPNERPQSASEVAEFLSSFPISQGENAMSQANTNAKVAPASTPSFMIAGLLAVSLVVLLAVFGGVYIGRATTRVTQGSQELATELQSPLSGTPEAWPDDTKIKSEPIPIPAGLQPEFNSSETASATQNDTLDVLKGWINGKDSWREDDDWQKSVLITSVERTQIGKVENAVITVQRPKLDTFSTNGKNELNKIIATNGSRLTVGFFDSRAEIGSITLDSRNSPDGDYVFEIPVTRIEEQLGNRLRDVVTVTLYTRF